MTPSNSVTFPLPNCLQLLQSKRKFASRTGGLANNARGVSNNTRGVSNNARGVSNDARGVSNNARGVGESSPPVPTANWQ
jgi:hypothetical protein